MKKPALKPERMLPPGTPSKPLGRPKNPIPRDQEEIWQLRAEAAAMRGDPIPDRIVFDRKNRDLLRSKFQNKFSDAVVSHLPENVETLQHLARGIWEEETTPEGERRVYSRPPDRQALMFLLEHGIGKATAREKKTASPVIQLIHRVPRPVTSRTPAPPPVEPEEEEEAELDDYDGGYVDGVDESSETINDERGFDDDEKGDDGE